jgi:hypothetical protein
MSSSEIRPPDGTTAIVHLVRHGEVHNPDKILYGRIPGFHLSEAGRLMAKAAADYLAGRDVTVLRSSPLQRALETAEPIAAELGLPVQVDDRLIEPWNYFEGMRFAVGDGALRQPRHCATRSGPPGVSPTVTLPPGCWPLPPKPRGTRTGTRRPASATSCPSGRPAARPRGAGCGTIRASASARSAA